MNILLITIGAAILIALVIRGLFGFYSDFTNNKPNEEKENAS